MYMFTMMRKLERRIVRDVKSIKMLSIMPQNNDDDGL